MFERCQKMDLKAFDSLHKGAAARMLAARDIGVTKQRGSTQRGDFLGKHVSRRGQVTDLPLHDMVFVENTFAWKHHQIYDSRTHESVRMQNRPEFSGRQKVSRFSSERNLLVLIAQTENNVL